MHSVQQASFIVNSPSLLDSDLLNKSQRKVYLFIVAAYGKQGYASLSHKAWTRHLDLTKSTINRDLAFLRGFGIIREGKVFSKRVFAPANVDMAEVLRRFCVDSAPIFPQPYKEESKQNQNLKTNNKQQQERPAPVPVETKNVGVVFEATPEIPVPAAVAERSAEQPKPHDVATSALQEAGPVSAPVPSQAAAPPRASVPAPAPLTPAEERLVKQLTGAGLERPAALRILKRYGHARIKLQLAALTHRKAEDRTAILLASLAGNWSLPRGFCTPQETTAAEIVVLPPEQAIGEWRNVADRLADETRNARQAVTIALRREKFADLHEGAQAVSVGT